MTQIKISNLNRFFEILFELRKRGVPFSAASDDQGFYYIEIPKE